MEDARISVSLVSTSEQEHSNSGGRISVNRLRLALMRTADGFGVEQNMPSLAVPTLLFHDPPIALTTVLKLHESSVSESKGVGDKLDRLGESVKNGRREELDVSV